jgi:hypothetical protein
MANSDERASSNLRANVVEMTADMTTLKENVRHLSTKRPMFTAPFGLLTAVGAIAMLVGRFVPHAG